MNRVLTATTYAILASIVLSSCVIVKLVEKEEEAPTIRLSPKPTIAMSDAYVRSTPGDMLAFLPSNWFFVEADVKASPSVFAVATNEAYNLSAVFAEIKSNPVLDAIYAKDSLLGVAKYTFNKRKRRTKGTLQLTEKYNYIESGLQRFTVFETSTTGGAVSATVAVFRSTQGTYYEFALIPMDILGKSLPPRAEISAIFNSIVATIKY